MASIVVGGFFSFSICLIVDRQAYHVMHVSMVRFRIMGKAPGITMLLEELLSKYLSRGGRRCWINRIITKPYEAIFLGSREGISKILIENLYGGQ